MVSTSATRPVTLWAPIRQKPWDLAALKILVEEAGGRFTDLTGTPTIYSGTGLATNGRLHAPALDLIRGRRETPLT
ncbi:MAG: hypothetical protein HYV93_05720 [Candidatus Rokubacteria bacterium]|nr:hypothetical protein [Candidatus Rokubacteria bacterium]